MESEIISKLPEKYRIALYSIINYACISFGNNLFNLTLGGSGGKGKIIEGWSDLDIYIILFNYDAEQIVSFTKHLNNISIHVGTTYYTLSELSCNMIDCKTKVMCYEKQNFNVNPTLYGIDIFNLVTHDEIIAADIRNLPNILHDVRRRYIDLIGNSDNVVTKPYIKKLLVLLKCILSCYGIFSYGYDTTVLKFNELAEKENFDLTPISDFDIMSAINNIENAKESVTKFSAFVLNFVDKYYQKEGVKNKWEKELVLEQ